jgi:hypothetical protein
MASLILTVSTFCDFLLQEISEYDWSTASDAVKKGDLDAEAPENKKLRAFRVKLRLLAGVSLPVPVVDISIPLAP